MYTCIACVDKEVASFHGATDYTGTAVKKTGYKTCNKYVAVVAKRRYKNNNRILRKANSYDMLWSFGHDESSANDFRLE